MWHNNYSHYNKQQLYQGAQPIVYRKTKFKSRLEATWAIFLDQYKLDWQYESQVGKDYVVDFYLPKVYLQGHQVQGVFMETKSPGAWGDPVEKWEIIKKAVSIIQKHGNHPFIIVLDQPGYQGEKNPIYEISLNEEGQPQVTTLQHFTLFKTGNIHKFTRLAHIDKKLKDDAREYLNEALRDFRQTYDQVKAADVRNLVKEAYEAEWTPERQQEVWKAEEVDQFMKEYWKDYISDYWTLEEFAKALKVERWRPQFVKDGDNYSKNATGEEYLLWNDNVIVENEGHYELSNRVTKVEKTLGKFTELKSTLPPRTVIETPSTVESLRRTIEAIEYEEYSLRFSADSLYYR